MSWAGNEAAKAGPAAGRFEALVDDLRAVLRLADGRAAAPSAVVMDSRTLRSTPESGERAGYDGAKREKGSKLHMAVDTLGHLLELHVTAAGIDDRAAVDALAGAVQAVTEGAVETASVDQDYAGARAAAAAERHGFELEIVRLLGAKRGFVCCRADGQLSAPSPERPASVASSKTMDVFEALSRACT